MFRPRSSTRRAGSSRAPTSRAGSPTCGAAARRRTRAARRRPPPGSGCRSTFERPDFTGTQQWFNTPGGRPLSLSRAARARSCWSTSGPTRASTASARCPTSRPGIASTTATGSPWSACTRPSSRSRRTLRTSQRAIGDFGLTYPVAQDNDYATWSAYHNQYWPADYLIDATGRVRLVHFGEGSYDETERGIREPARRGRVRPARSHGERRTPRRPDPHATPESYLGAARAARFANGQILAGRQSFRPVPTSELSRDQLAYGGRWTIGGEAATAGRAASLELDFSARRVFLVLGSPGRPRTMRVLLDGKPIPSSLAGPDVHGGVATISNQRLYRLVDLPRSGEHVLTLQPQAGIAGYAFTFG